MEYNLTIPISPGELIDKLTILRLKSERIVDSKKLDNISREQIVLQEVWDNSSYSNFDITAEIEELYQINSSLWDIEDGMRDKERVLSFDVDFIELARREYKANDHRAKIKKDINTKLGSLLVEEKSYQPY